MLVILMLSWLGVKNVCAQEIESQRPKAERWEPEGRIIEHEGAKYWAYTLEESRKMEHIFEDYHLMWKYITSVEVDILSYQREVKQWQFRVDNWKEASETQRRRGDMLSKMFDEEHRLRLNIESTHNKFNWVPWTLLVIESVAFGAIGVYSAASQ